MADLGIGRHELDICCTATLFEDVHCDHFKPAEKDVTIHMWPRHASFDVASHHTQAIAKMNRQIIGLFFQLSNTLALGGGGGPLS